MFENLWKNDQIKSWFDGDGDVRTEVVVLPDQGETRRIDRVILKDQYATVIDFKSGKPATTDRKQVQAYNELLERMGYVTKGYLLYLNDAEVVAV